MTLEEYVKHRLENDLNCLYVNSNFTIAFDPIYNKSILNDVSKPKAILFYDSNDNTIIFTKIDMRTRSLIHDETTEKFKYGDVKDKQTFLDFVCKELNPYCREHNCDYNTYIHNNFVGYYKGDCISIKSPTNPNQEIIYNEANKLLHFLEVYKGSEPITDQAFEIREKYSYLINKNNFAELAKESFEFCEENECSFADYANKIFFNLMELKYNINKYTEENPQEKLLYTVFDKDGKTAFTYYDNNIITVFKIINDRPIYAEMEGLPNFINSNEEFKAFIKENKTFINRQFNEQLRRAQQQKLNGLMGAMRAFRGHYRKR